MSQTRHCSSPAMEAEPPRSQGEALTARSAPLGPRTIIALLGPGREAGRVGLPAGAGSGELEPHAGAVLPAHAPPSGEQLDQMQPEAAFPATGAPGDRTLTAVLDFHLNHAV